MLKQSRPNFKIIALMACTLSFLGCTGGNVSSSIGSSSSTAVDSGPAGSSNGVADPDSFFVGLDSTISDIGDVHKTGDDPINFSTNCAITPSGSALQDISCTFDIPEAEIMQNGLSFIYNVPPNMCRYLRRRTYWYYNQEVGVGPKNIDITRLYQEGVLISFTCSVDGSAPSATCTGYSEVSIDPTGPTLKCVYDRSANGLGNGCFGGYTLTVTDRKITASPASDVTTTATTNNKWGGSMAAVLGGAAKYGWPVSTNGIPLNVVNNAKDGLLNVIYTIPAPVQNISTRTTLEIANYSTAALHTHTGFGPVLTPIIATRTSTLPYFVDPVDDRNGTKIPTDVIDPTNYLEIGQPTYDFECLDQAYEVLHRVRVTVREWDTYQDYVNYITSKGTIALPDRSGTEEAKNCSGVSGPCNDFFDVDDYVNLYLGGAYDMTLPGLAKRQTYFPYVMAK